jgi:hypothetical protein
VVFLRIYEGRQTSLLAGEEIASLAKNARSQ